MARSNLAYKQDRREQTYRPEPVSLPRPKLRTIEGQGRKSAAQPQQKPWVHTLLAMSIAVIVVLATTSVGRIGIANATVQMMQTAEQTQSAIDEARAVGLELEVKHSLSNNPTRIQDLAATRGVLPSSQPQTLEARNGFSTETQRQMQQAAAEAQAAELALLAQGSSGEASGSAASQVNEDTSVPAPADSLESDLGQ